MVWRKQERGEDLLHDGAHGRKRQSGRATAHPLALDVRVGDGGQDHVMLPAGIRAAFEMVETELALEFLVLLFDGPALMRQRDKARSGVRGGRWTK